MDSLLEQLQAKARGCETDLLACLATSCDSRTVEGTSATTYCHHVKLDGNGRPLIADLAKLICYAAIDYAIPRERVADARDWMIKTGSADRFTLLCQEARSLFTDAVNTGEGGELLLFLFAERLLRLPQLLSKMSLKTTTRRHYEGSDAIHAGVTETGNLALYWGESKIYADWKSAVTACLKDLSPFLRKDNGRDSRDIQLLRQYIDIGDDALANALVEYLSPTSARYMTAEYRGLAFIGFSAEVYSSESGLLTSDSLLANIAACIDEWCRHTSTRLLSERVHSFHIHLFFLPFPDADAFRLQFRREMGLTDGD